MIVVEKNHPRRVCESCYSKDEVYQISLGVTEYDMHSIAVCKTCLDEINKEVEKT